MKLIDIHSILLHSVILKPLPLNLALFSVTLSHICLVSFKLFFLYQVQTPIRILFYKCMNRTSMHITETLDSVQSFFFFSYLFPLLVNNAPGISSNQLVFSVIQVHYFNSCLVKGLCCSHCRLSFLIFLFKLSIISFLQKYLRLLNLNCVSKQEQLCFLGNTEQCLQKYLSVTLGTVGWRSDALGILQGTGQTPPQRTNLSENVKSVLRLRSLQLKNFCTFNICAVVWMAFQQCNI